MEKQLLLIDVFNSWTGPCIAAETYLKRLKHETEGLVLARACSDTIEDLYAFQGYVCVFIFSLYIPGQYMSLVYYINNLQRHKTNLLVLGKR